MSYREPAIVPVSEWGGKQINNRSLTRLPPLGIVLHHTASPNRKIGTTSAHEQVLASRLALSIQEMHMRGDRGRPWRDSGQHFTISRGGLILEGRTGSLDCAMRGLVLQGAHAGVHEINARWFGIEIEGLYETEAPPKVQLDAVIALCTFLSLKGRIQSAAIEGHRKWRKTLCPGKVLFDLLPDIRAAVKAGKLSIIEGTKNDLTP